MLAALLGLLTAAQPAQSARGLRVEELPNGQFRIIVANRGMGANQLANAMVRAELETRAEAARRCQGLGGPVPVDRGQITILQNERWESVQTFACRTPAATPPPEG